MSIAGVLAIAGCGQRQADNEPVPSEPAASTAASGAESTPASATKDVLSGGAEFARKSLASPFAQADQALKESFDAALIAFQIGDYARAAGELRLLAKTPGLTPDQKKAVQYLLAQTLKAAPELATQPEARAGDGSMALPPGYSVAGPDGTRPGGAEFTQKSLASPFAQAGQALKESYDSALVAVQIGDYDRAVNELKALAENPDLTAEQMQAVRDLMTETVKAAPSPGTAPADETTPVPPQ